MKKLLSLIRACFKDNMSIFKIKSKNKNSKYLPFILTLVLMISFYNYSELLIEPLIEVHLEYVVITLFVVGTCVMTFMEGIYKSSGILFNCKDDDLLLSLPIKKSTVLFVRLLKFYVFELLFNSLFLIPALISYAVHVNPGIMYYIASLFGILLLPIIPIVLSTIMGIFISFVSSLAKNKNIMQTIFTFILCGVIYVISFRMNGFVENLAENAKSINDLIIKIYYPAGLFINMIINFKFIDLIKFILVNVLPLVILVLTFKNMYFSINSSLKSVKKKSGHSKDTNYKIVTSSKRSAFIKKEIKKLINTPVYILNSCFGLVLYLGIIIYAVINIDDVISKFQMGGANIPFDLYSIVPLAILGLVIFTSLLSSLTCSMISLEGKSFNILKSLPIKPIEIIMYKVYTVLVVEIPIILIGVIISIIKFKIGIVPSLLLIVASCVFPFISGIFGIIVNIKYPKLDAKDDTEVVKQSMSSFIAVTGGMLGTGAFIYLMFKLIDFKLNISLVMLAVLILALIIAYCLYWYAKKVSSKEFEKLVV